MTTGSFHTPNTQRKGRRWSDSQMDGPFFHLPTTDFLFLRFLDSQRNQKCGSLPGYLNGKDPFNSQAGDEVHIVAFISQNLVSSSENIFSIELGRKGGWWSLGGRGGKCSKSWTKTESLSSKKQTGCQNFYLKASCNIREIICSGSIPHHIKLHEIKCIIV